MKYAALLLIPVLALLIFFSGGLVSGPAAPKVIILGIDGMDPRLLSEFLDEGIMPNFRKLIETGDFSELETTMPPLSPVAWSTFITGTLPSRHGVFDFLHRDPATIRPESAMVRTSSSDWTVSLGRWVIPLTGGKIEPLREGTAFWELLAEAGIPVSIYRMPVNFPPAPVGEALSGMGTPDLLGTSGTFTYYTTEPLNREVSGGRVLEVELDGNSAVLRLEGPPNTFYAGETEPKEDTRETNSFLAIDFIVDVDPEEPVARFAVQGSEFVLKQGEWSDWIPVDFPALPYLVDISSAVRFYLKEAKPGLKLYVTPLQISPKSPAMPITHPEEWSRQLEKDLGSFYTQELPEDTKAFSSGVFDGREFWEQSQFVYREERKMLTYALERFEEGLLFFYFSSVDQGCHMLWQYTDPQHPAYVADEFLIGSIRTLYRQMDEALGEILEKAGEDTTVVVMSDHGFSPFYWQVDLNSWLLERGYVRLKDPLRRDGFPLFTNVEWSATQAYAVGLNGLYVNLRGREHQGVVSQGYAYQALLDLLQKDLLEMVDPRNGRHPVTYVLRTGRDYAGAASNRAPDIIVGYAWGYRSSWKSPLGEFPREVFQDNLDPWSGDHSIDYREVPGVLVTNRKITADRPALYDLTVAILDRYGVAKTERMLGQNCLN
jgi:predicted AlkP superfamily phosphohydrolase/phosphomutase